VRFHMQLRVVFALSQRCLISLDNLPARSFWLASRRHVPDV
jgi:hypothetical protein